MELHIEQARHDDYVFRCVMLFRFKGVNKYYVIHWDRIKVESKPNKKNLTKFDSRIINLIVKKSTGY